MKKVLIGFLLLLLVFFAAAYLFIPGKMQIRAETTVSAALPGVFRALSDNEKWKIFWPGSTTFKYHDYTYTIKSNYYNVLNVEINSGHDTVSSFINLLPVKSDLLTIEWNAEQISSRNPFKRFVEYRQASALEKNLDTIIYRIKEFVEQPENIYGFDIQQKKVMDSVLISTKRSLDHKPSLKDIDEMIQSLKKYILANNGIEKNSPMLNVVQLDSSHYQVMTAIPVDRELPMTKEFTPKFLLKGGNILEAGVIGGPSKIETGLSELENFKNDYKLASPAIPFQLLITDRLKEPDTTKWVTRLYYPIF